LRSQKLKPQEPVATEPKSDESALPGVKVVGKINLDDLNSKTRPDKKSPEPEKPVAIPAPAAKVEEPVKAKEPEVIPQPVAEKVEPKVEPAPVTEAKEPVKVRKKLLKNRLKLRLQNQQQKRNKKINQIRRKAILMLL
jgi:hypothetical protein